MARRASIHALVATTAVAGLGVGSWQSLQTGSPSPLFQASFRLLCYAQQPLTGLSVRFDRVGGSLREGKLDFQGLHIVWDRKRLVPQKFDCDLAIEQLTVDVGPANAHAIIRETQAFLARLDSIDEADAFQVDHLTAKGVRGHYTALIRKPETPPPNVLIMSLNLENIAVQVADGYQRASIVHFPDLAVQELRMEKIRFQNAVPALLLGTEGRGSVGGVPFSFENRARVSVSLPIQWMSQFLQAPLNWIQRGRAGVDVTLSPSKPGHAIVNVKLSVDDGVATEDASDSIYGAASGKLAAYMSSNHIGLSAKEEINLDDTDGRKFLTRLNEKFGAVLIRDGLVGSLNLAAQELKKRGWF